MSNLKINKNLTASNFNIIITVIATISCGFLILYTYLNMGFMGYFEKSLFIIPGGLILYGMYFKGIDKKKVFVLVGIVILVCLIHQSQHNFCSKKYWFLAIAACFATSAGYIRK